MVKALKTWSNLRQSRTSPSTLRYDFKIRKILNIFEKLTHIGECRYSNARGFVFWSKRDTSRVHFLRSLTWPWMTSTRSSRLSRLFLPKFSDFFRNFRASVGSAVENRKRLFVLGPAWPCGAGKSWSIWRNGSVLSVPWPGNSWGENAPVSPHGFSGVDASMGSFWPVKNCGQSAERFDFSSSEIFCS